MTSHIKSILAAFAVTALVGIAAPAAHAAGSTSGTIKLAVTKEGPVYGDDNALIYHIHVTNSGPAAASGVVLRVTGYECPGPIWSAASCSRLPDRVDPTQPMDYNVDLETIPAGQEDAFPVTSYLPNETSGTVRTTVEVIHSDQSDSASVQGSCAQGQNPQPDCVSDVVSIT